MHLKSLNLKGFKSFADRSVLGFEPGITAIVGPNGSGKSNISDSVLWVLGERNAKNLRGQAMEDVVFAGSSARKPVGVAEVDLVLDNSDGTLPIDFNEVALTRRMYRSGESEYLINGSIARRMDVLDILHDTGLGTGTHSIISQGSLDSILQSKPEDRRALIEEAAGVLKHKQRKQKSERKLEQMDNHLMRVKDVTAEVERQLKPLERKAKRAQAYQGLAAELAELSLSLAVDDLRVLQGAWKKTTDSEQVLSEELEAMRAAIGAAETHMQALQEQIQERSESTGDISRRYRRIQSVVERFDAATLLLQEKKRAASSYESEIHYALEANAAKMIQTKEACVQAAMQLDGTGQEKAQASQTVDQLEKEQAELEATRSSLEKALEEGTRRERELGHGIEAARLAQSENQELLSNNRAQEKLIAGHSKEIQAQLERAEKDHAAGLLHIESLEEKLDSLEKGEKAAREAVSASYSSREQAQAALDSLRDRIALLAAEAKGLEEMERAYETASPALAWLLGNKDMLDGGIELLSHVISVPVGLEQTVEWVLGGDIRALVVDDLATANMIAGALRHEGEPGEVVLFPRRPDGGARVRESAKGERLISLLEYPSDYAEAIDAAIGDVYLCGDIDEAIRAYESSGPGCRFVTRDGIMVCGNGKIVVGMARPDEQGILARHRRLEQVKAEKEAAEASLDEAVASKEKADRDLKRAQTESLTLSQQLAQMQGNFSAAKEESKRNGEKLDALHREYEYLVRQRDEAQAALMSAQPASEKLSEDISALQAELSEAKAANASIRGDLGPLREQSKALEDRLSQARLSLAMLAERESYARRMLEAGSQDEATLRMERSASLESLASKTIAKDRVAPLLAIFEELALTAKRWACDLEDEMSRTQDMSSGLHAAVTEARAAARKAHDAFEAANSRLSDVRVEKGRLEIQVEAAIGSIVDDCKVPLEKALDMPGLEDRQAIEDTAFKLRRKIANMGTINPDAAFEYEELKARFDYMARQLDDMMGARRALAKIVRVIDARMKEDFVTTFDRVNENFKEIFSVLFPGGSAELSLVDPDEPETTGVEVTAQPRGKRITKMMLMSGGEKSLTALALLFAVYKIRSTPFYILDEVEAALDDTNLRRLCAYFDSLRHTTQLILITHQRRTMELADVLYGISMQADGVTRVVSQKLDRALQYAEG